MTNLHMKDLDLLLSRISAFGDADRDPPAAKKLEMEHIQELLLFTSSPDEEVIVKAVSNLGDAARIAHNRDLIGAMTPMGNLALLLQKYDNNLLLKTKVIRVVGNLCFDHPYNREKLQEVKGIDLIIKCLSAPDEELQRVASGCLANLASNTENIAEEIFHLGGVPELIKLLDSPNDNVQCMAARALRNIAETEEIRLFYAKNNMLERSLEVIKNTEDDDGMILEFFGIINSLINTKTICQDFVHKYSGLKILMHSLEQATDLNLIVDLTDFLCGIADQDEYKDLFLSQGLVPKIRQLFLDNNLKAEVRVSAGKVYSSLSVSNQILPLMYKELDDFIKLLKDENKEIQTVASMIIGNLARTDEYCFDIVNRGLGEELIKIIGDEERDLRVRNYCVATLRNLALNDKNKPVLLKLNVLAPAIKLLQQPKTNQVIVYHAIGVIKALLLGGVVYADAFIDANGLDHLAKLISFDEDHVKYEACRIIGLLSKEEKYHQILIDSKTLPAILNLLNGRFDVLKVEGALAVKFFAGNEKNNFKEIVGLYPGIIKSIIESLKEEDENKCKKETKIIMLASLKSLVTVPKLAKHIYNYGGYEVLKNLEFEDAKEVLKVVESVKETPFDDVDLLFKQEQEEEKKELEKKAKEELENKAKEEKKELENKAKEEEKKEK